MIMGHPTEIGWQGEQLLATPVVGHQARPQASGRLGLLLRSPASLLGCSAWVLVGLFAREGGAGGDLGQLASRGPSCAAQVRERLLVIQAFAFHQRALGPLDQSSGVKGCLELLGQGMLHFGPGRCPSRRATTPA
jgi:hypothetical protein